MKKFTWQDCKNQADKWMRESWLVNLKHYHYYLWLFIVMTLFGMAMTIIGIWMMELSVIQIVKEIINELL